MNTFKVGDVVDWANEIRSARVVTAVDGNFVNIQPDADAAGWWPADQFKLVKPAPFEVKRAFVVQVEMNDVMIWARDVMLTKDDVIQFTLNPK